MLSMGLLFLQTRQQRLDPRVEGIGLVPDAVIESADLVLFCRRRTWCSVRRTLHCASEYGLGLLVSGGEPAFEDPGQGPGGDGSAKDDCAVLVDRGHQPGAGAPAVAKRVEAVVSRVGIDPALGEQFLDVAAGAVPVRIEDGEPPNQRALGTEPRVAVPREDKLVDDELRDVWMCRGCR